MRRMIGAVALAVLTACGSTSGDDEPIVTPTAVTPPPPATDPRVSELQIVVAELLDRLEVMNARVHKLESGAPAPRPVETVAAVTPSEPSNPPAASRPTRRATPPPAAQRQRPTAGATLAEKYRAGLELFGKGQIDLARTEFQEVFDSDQNGELADNALYWVGETYYLTGKYSEALTQYQRVLTDYSDQNKAPDAMLKIGLSYAKLGDLALARRTYQDLIAKYPFSTPAAAAKYELKRIQY